jgi:hypothetical protein
MRIYMAFTPPLRANFAFAAVFSFIILLSSCSDPATVGLELAPGNNQIGVFYQEFVLDAEMVLVDSLNTTTNTISRGVLVVGHEQDEFFGVNEATTYSRLFIDVTADRPRTDAILDSVFFALDVIAVNGQNLDSPKSYAVHELEEPILDTVYFNSDKLAYSLEPVALGEVVFEDVKDTIVNLPVSPEFSERLFGFMKRGPEFENLLAFRRLYPGIALKAKAGDQTTLGLQQGVNTGFLVYYHYPEDTVSTLYRVSTGSSRAFIGVESDRSGTPTEVITTPNQSYDVGTKVGMKASLGMALKVDTSPLDTFLDTLSGITFNQVLFEIGDIDEVPEGQTPLFSYYIYFTDQNNKFIRRPSDRNPVTLQLSGQPQTELDADGNTVLAVRAPAQAIFSQANQNYSVDIAGYLNALFRGDITRTDWLLYGGLVNTATQDDDFKKSLRQFVVDKNRIKVKVIYSKRR